MQCPMNRKSKRKSYHMTRYSEDYGGDDDAYDSEELPVKEENNASHKRSYMMRRERAIVSSNDDQTASDSEEKSWRYEDEDLLKNISLQIELLKRKSRAKKP
eukprot:293345_1